MTSFVHITDARNATAIKNSGIHLPKSKLIQYENQQYKYGVFALPVIPNFVVSHQWLREMKRRGFKTAVGVYFAIPDSEEVWAGKYNEEKQLLSANSAAGYLFEHETLGYEVIIPRSINASEILKVRHLPQILGWRYYPNSNNQVP